MKKVFGLIVMLLMFVGVTTATPSVSPIVKSEMGFTITQTVTVITIAQDLSLDNIYYVTPDLVTNINYYVTPDLVTDINYYVDSTKVKGQGVGDWLHGDIQYNLLYIY